MTTTPQPQDGPGDDAEHRDESRAVGDAPLDEVSSAASALLDGEWDSAATGSPTGSTTLDPTLVNERLRDFTELQSRLRDDADEVPIATEARDRAISTAIAAATFLDGADESIETPPSPGNDEPVGTVRSIDTARSARGRRTPVLIASAAVVVLIGVIGVVAISSDWGSRDASQLASLDSAATESSATKDGSASGTDDAVADMAPTTTTGPAADSFGGLDVTSMPDFGPYPDVDALVDALSPSSPAAPESPVPSEGVARAEGVDRTGDTSVLDAALERCGDSIRQLGAQPVGVATLDGTPVLVAIVTRNATLVVIERDTCIVRT